MRRRPEWVEPARQRSLNETIPYRDETILAISCKRPETVDLYWFPQRRAETGAQGANLRRAQTQGDDQCSIHAG